jgi:hypothetical protein
MASFLDIFLAVVCSVFGCAAANTDTQTISGEPPPPPDLSFLAQPNNHCKVSTSAVTALSPANKCMLKSLSARCTPADDCLVQCLVSKDGPHIGGGCWHACFETKFNLSSWSEPQGAAKCHELGRINGS